MSRVSLQRRVKLINLSWTTPRIFPRVPRKTGFPRTVQGKEQDTFFWGSTRSSLPHYSHPALLPHRQWWTSSADDVKANSEQLFWDRERGKKLNCYWETVPCIFLNSLHWNVAAERLFWWKRQELTVSLALLPTHGWSVTAISWSPSTYSK